MIALLLGISTRGVQEDMYHIYQPRICALTQFLQLAGNPARAIFFPL